MSEKTELEVKQAKSKIKYALHRAIWCEDAGDLEDRDEWFAVALSAEKEMVDLLVGTMLGKMESISYGDYERERYGTWPEKYTPDRI